MKNTLETKMVKAFFQKAKEQNPQANFTELVAKTMEISKGYFAKNPDKAKGINIFDYVVIRVMAEEMFNKLSGGMEDMTVTVTEVSNKVTSTEEEILKAIGEVLFDKLHQVSSINEKYKELKESHEATLVKARKLNEAYKALKNK